ncbi:MAG: GerAB/ArcD/ProY family transporter, partial [Clostridia bacterium]|nr:GerAB/ArcD/ProY family transporter [Clostridia bacterium]
AKDGWLVLLLLGIVDILMLLLAIWFFNRFNGRGFVSLLQNAYGKFVAGLIFFVLFGYFVIKAIMPFEALHDLFANVLFDQVDYSIFGIMLLFVVAYVAVRGLRVIGRQCEIFTLLIGLGIVGVVALGMIDADFSRLFPIFASNSASAIIFETLKDAVWFGDYVLLFCLVGLVSLKQDEKIGWNLILPYGAIVVIVPLCYAIYYAHYGNVAILQPNAISALTQFSLLRLDIGRVDWFLVLFEQISTIISASLYIFLAALFFCRCFKIQKTTIPAVVIAIAIYMLDVSIFVNINSSVFDFRKYTYIFMLAVNIIIPVFALIAGFANRKRVQA